MEPAAVKAAHALSQAGCSTFFVAQLSEAALLRPGLSDAVIYILNGLVPGHASAFTELDVRPVLGKPGRSGGMGKSLP